MHLLSPSALEHFKRWLIPEKVAISAEELEYLLRPSQNKEAAEPSQTQNDEDAEEERHSPEEDDTHSPEIWVRFKILLHWQENSFGYPYT